MSGSPYRVTDEGLKLHILVSPKARKDEVTGCELLLDDRCGEIFVLRVKVRALADKGLANKAVLKVIANWLDVPKTSIDLISGSKARYKTLLIEGLGKELAQKFEQCLLKNSL